MTLDPGRSMNTTPLLKSEDRWVTTMGAWFPGERVVFRGQDLHVDLADMDWMALYLFGITGRRHSEAQLRVLNAIWTSTSFPEPRLWNNRVCALAGTARSTGSLAISAAMAVSEASVYGGRPFIRSIDFLIRAQQQLSSGINRLSEIINSEIKNYRYIYGYGRPVVTTDERMPHLLRIVHEVGLEQGDYLKLAFEVERELLKKKPNVHMNVAGLDAALAADMGMCAREFYLFMIPCFVSGMLPCLIDTSVQQEGSFFPLSCDRIAYQGTGKRSWL